MSMVDRAAERFSRGKKFRSGKNTGTFNKEIKKAVIESPSFRSLKDNVKDVIEAVEDIEKYAAKDELTTSMERKAVSRFKRKPGVTDQDVKEFTAIVRRIGKAGAPKNISTKTKKLKKSDTRKKRITNELKRDPREYLFSQQKKDVSDNPLSRQPYNPDAGAGGGVGAAKGRGSLAGGPPSAKKSSYQAPPRLLR